MTTQAKIPPAPIDPGSIRWVYTAIAPVYDLWAIFTERRARTRALELAAIRDGESVLEVAVGTGLAFEEIVKTNPTGQNEGIDLTPAMLARARRRLERTGVRGRHHLAVADACALPFDDGSFDVVHNAYMFDLLPEAHFDPVLREMARVLRPGGRLVVLDMAPSYRWYHAIPAAICRLGGCRGVNLAPFVERAGFTDLRVEPVIQMGFPSEIVCAVAPAA